MSVADEIAAWQGSLAARAAELPIACTVTQGRRVVRGLDPISAEPLTSAPWTSTLDDALLRAEPHTRSTINKPKLKGEWVQPAAPSIGSILYIHGDAQNASVETHRRLAGDICGAASARVLTLEYRRPPEHQFPAPVEDALAALAWMEATGDLMNDVVVAGDSFGAMPVLSAVIARRDSNLPLPSGIYLLCPKTDYSNTPHRVVYDSNPDTCPAIKAMDGYFYGGLDGTGQPFWVEDTVAASPFLDSLIGLPPVLIQTTTGDTSLYPHALALRDKLLSAGNACTFQEWQEVPHNWAVCPQFFAAAGEAIADAGAWMRERLT